MAKTRAEQTSQRELVKPSAVAAARAAALFVAPLQPSEAPTLDQVRRVVATAGRRASAATCLSRADAEDISR
jgi:hypothetical protein